MSYSESNLVEKLKRLQQTEESIQTLSQWALMYAKHHKRTVDIWMREFKASSVDRKLLLYFCNDVMQTSRKKTLDFIKAFSKVLPEAFKIVRADRNPSLTKATNRLLDVWEQRTVFSVDFVRGLRGGTSGAGGVTYTSAPQQQARPSAAPRGFSKPHPLVTLEEQIAAAEQQVTDTERRASNLLDRVQLDDGAITQAVGNGTVGQLQSGVAAARAAFTAQQLAIEAEVRLRESLVVDLQKRADAAAAALANAQTKLTSVAERSARADACDARINAASSAPVDLAMSRQDSGGFQVGGSGDPTVQQQPTLALSGTDGAPVDLFAQLAKVREQLAGAEAPSASAVRSPAVDPRKKPSPAAADEPSSKRQRSEPEPGVDAAATGSGSDAATVPPPAAAAAPAAPSDATSMVAGDAGAEDLFAKLAQVQQAQAAASTGATDAEGPAAGSTAAEQDNTDAQTSGDAGVPPGGAGASDPVGGPSVDQWNGANGGVDMGFEVLP